MVENAPKQVTFTARAKVVTGAEALEATTAFHGKLLVTTLARLSYNVTTAKIMEELQGKYDINRRLARSVVVEAEGMRSSVVEGAAARLVGTNERLWRLEKRIVKAAKKDRRQLRGLNQRLQILRARQRRDEALVAGEIEPSVCLGGKKLAKQRHALENDKEVAAWQEEWRKARAAQVFFPGERDRSSGNNECKLHLSDGSKDDPDTLTIRVPKTVYEKTGQPTITLQLKGLGYARSRLAQALMPDVEQLARRQEAFKGGKPARNGGKPATTLPEALACRLPLTVRVWTDKQGVLRVALTILRSVSLPQTTSDLAYGALGVDVNPDHLAVCRVDKHGNPLLWKKLPIKTTGSSGERLASIHAAVNAACRLALASAVKDGVDVPVVTERLHFGYPKTNLPYLPARLANKLSSFAYSAILQLITVRSANLGLQNFTVSPAYTSKLGQANYAAPYGVSTDLGAACCIARRAKGLKERLRPLVLSCAPEDAQVAASSRSVNRAVASVRLPSRSQTYSCSWLSRSRGSATPSEVDGERLLGTSGLQQSQLVF